MKDPKILSEFGARLRTLRNKRGFTLEQLGMRLRPEVCPATAENYLVKLELGYRLPRYSDLVALSRIFDVEISHLADLAPEFEPEKSPKKQAPHDGLWRKRSPQEVAARLQTKVSQPRRPKTSPRLHRSVVHAGHLREMSPERLGRLIDEILRGNIGYSGIQKDREDDR